MHSIIKTASRRNPLNADTPANRPENATVGFRNAYSWGQYALFLGSGYILLFAMCAAGRAGA